MDTHRPSNGWQTFREHYALAITATLAFLASEVFGFFTRLKGVPWLCFFGVSFLLLTVGGFLIGYAKWPAYRSGRLLSFGLTTVPERLRGFYLWGWRLFLFGVVLSLGLLLSSP